MRRVRHLAGSFIVGFWTVFCVASGLDAQIIGSTQEPQPNPQERQRDARKVGDPCIAPVPPPAGSVDRDRWVVSEVVRTRPDEYHDANLFYGAAPSVVHINVIDQNGRTVRRGSGFIWNNEGHVITNSHVIGDLDRPPVSLEVVTTDVTPLGTPGSVDSVLGKRDVTWARYRGVQIIGRSLWHDLAVLKIDLRAPLVSNEWTRPTPYPVRITQRSFPLVVGQRVYAIGSPLDESLRRTMTTGSLSGLWRRGVTESGVTLFDLIQTDASIHRGNSGGPLFDSEGNLIGVVAAGRSSPPRPVDIQPVLGELFATPVLNMLGKLLAEASIADLATLNFAIPASTVCRIVPELIESGHYSRPRLGGAYARNAGDPPQGVYFLGVRAGAKDAGLVSAVGASGNSDDLETILRRMRNDEPETPTANFIDRIEVNLRQTTTGRPTDIIQKIDGNTVRTTEDLWYYLDYYEPGQKVTIEVLRGNERAEIEVELSEAPEDGDPVDQLTDKYRASW